METQTYHYPDIHFTVVATPNTYHVDFKIYEIAGYGNGSLETGDFTDPLYGPQFQELGPDTEVFADGSVKWDGCSNWDIGPEGCMVHGCDKEDLINIGIVLSRCWDLTKELCPKWIDL